MRKPGCISCEKLAKKGITPKDIVTKESLLNTIMVDMAIAGSTNAVIHILAYATELGIPLTLDDFDALANEIKCIVKASFLPAPIQ